jgi:tripartite-type tricarboxylate transporter receptor subunit TctC
MRRRNAMTDIHDRRSVQRRRLGLLSMVALPVARTIGAQALPPMTLIVPNAAGGSADRVARVAAVALGELLDRRIDVINITGAGGVTGTNAIAGYKPDGNTLGLAVSTPMIAGRLLSPAATYNPVDDFEWLAILGTYPNAMVVSSRRPERTLDELLAAARNATAPLAYGSFGVGTAGHLAGSYLRLEQQAKLEHVAFERVDDGYAQLASGQIDILFDGVPNAASAAPRAGHRIVAVTSAARVPTLPDTPAFGERWPREYFVVWVGIVAPRGLPPDVYSRMASAIGVMMLEPRHAQALRATGLTYAGLNGLKAKAYVDDEIVRTARLIARLGGETTRRP